jgi:hypothetical protein
MATPGPKVQDSDRQFWTDVGLVLWSSFLAAGAASMLFFAAVDPLILRDAGPQRFENLSREAGYGLGFLFFWALAASAAALCVYMIRSVGRRDDRSATHRELS